MWATLKEMRGRFGTHLPVGKQTDISSAKIFQERQSGKKQTCELLWSFKVPHKNFYIGSGWLASLTFISRKQHHCNFLWTSWVCCYMKRTFILICGANGDNSQAHICILINPDFIQSLSEDRFVVVDVADENPHVCCVCRNDRTAQD